MIEPERPLKRTDQIRADKEEARRLQAQFDEEAKLVREKAQQEIEAKTALIHSWGEIQSKFDADYQLAERLQAEEQAILIDKEKAKLFVQLLEKRKKHFTALRAHEKRNKPPTKLNREKLCLLISKIWLDTNMDTKVVEGSKTRIESSTKRTGEDLERESSKKQKVSSEQEAVEEEINDEQEKARLNECMQVVPKDLEVLYKLVMDKYGDTKPVDDLDLLLRGNLKIIFEPHVEDEV
ncbi:hypothetical protein Tco_0721037 [Tanacetum coccineum]